MNDEPGKSAEVDLGQAESELGRMPSSLEIPSRQQQLRYLPLLFIAIAIIVIIVVVVHDPPRFNDVQELKEYARDKLGYLGVLVMGLVGSSSPVWPLPGSWAAFIAGGAGLNPFLLGLAAGFGEPVGESTAYMAGFGGQVAVTNVRGYTRVVRWMQRHGTVTLFLVCAIPNFFTKAAVIAAGALRYPFWKFFLVCWAGKTVKSAGFAITGYYFFEATFDLMEKWFG